MKKLSIIFLMLFYSISSSGFTVYLHYCCGELEKISLSSRLTHEDCNEEKTIPLQEGEEGCCTDDKAVDIKLKATDEVSQYALNNHSVELSEPANNLFVYEFSRHSNYFRHRENSNGTTRPSGQIYLLNSSFRI